MALLDEYEEVLTTKPLKGQKEQNVQNFLEEHSELLPTPNLRNHQLHFNCVISKYPIGPYITDYVYITKSSNEWKIVLVELEDPNKLYFSDKDLKSTIFTATFNAALQQVKDWQIYVSENKETIIRKLYPLIKPESMRDNPINFEYLLIYGRSDNRDASKERKKRIDMWKKDNHIEIYSYDTIRHDYENDRFPRKKLILSPLQEIFSIKKLDDEPTIFSDVSASELEIDKEYIEELKKKGYQMDEWLKGRKLCIAHKYVDTSKILEAMKSKNSNS